MDQLGALSAKEATPSGASPKEWLELRGGEVRAPAPAWVCPGFSRAQQKQVAQLPDQGFLLPLSFRMGPGGG